MGRLSWIIWVGSMELQGFYEGGRRVKEEDVKIEVE